MTAPPPSQLYLLRFLSSGQLVPVTWQAIHSKLSGLVESGRSQLRSLPHLSCEALVLDPLGLAALLGKQALKNSASHPNPQNVCTRPAANPRVS